jgi:hypothetical protein
MTPIVRRDSPPGLCQRRHTRSAGGLLRMRPERGGTFRPSSSTTLTLTPRPVVPSHWRKGGPIKLAGDTGYPGRTRDS